MSSVFTDYAHDYDLTISNDAEWTIIPTGMPNGDPYLYPIPDLTEIVYNMHGSDFDFGDGTAWSIEFWYYYTSGTADGSKYQCPISCGKLALKKPVWAFLMDPTERMTFAMYNTTSLTDGYLSVFTDPLETAKWYHIVVVKETGNVLKMYVNGVIVSRDTTPDGTIQHPGSLYRVYLGRFPNGSYPLDSNSHGHRIGKMVIYNSELSVEDINLHYLAMIAT